ncbi:hypothetical protein [Massilia suwonensis]|uniref:Uncharacterized protein n=1 Tax=Massilia suwonensis TaxID=648895 RepID=A0ABW0MR81_9BURK
MKSNMGIPAKEEAPRAGGVIVSMTFSMWKVLSEFAEITESTSILSRLCHHMDEHAVAAPGPACRCGML